MENKSLELKKAIIKTMDLKFEWRINVFYKENYISTCIINSTLDFATEKDAIRNMEKVIDILNLD